eukprot:4696333-Prymnesium_polylepis.1
MDAALAIGGLSVSVRAAPPPRREGATVQHVGYLSCQSATAVESNSLLMSGTCCLPSPLPPNRGAMLYLDNTFNTPHRSDTLSKRARNYKLARPRVSAAY